MIVRKQLSCRLITMKRFFNQYVPERFCREFVEIRGHSSSLVNYMAVVTGLKPLMDDWIPVDTYRDFERTANKKYGLCVKPGAVWLKEAPDDYLRQIHEGASLTTTKFIGARYENGMKDGELHVFIAKSEEALEKGYRTGWYPLVIDGIAVKQPFADNVQFGRELGYPDCCLDYFVENNHRGSFLKRIKNNTAGEFNYLCNCLPKDASFSYIYHMPCSFNCESSVSYAEALRKEIDKREPELVGIIDGVLKNPYLVLKEQHIYVFDGVAGNMNEIVYSDVKFAGKARYNIYEKMLASGDELRIEDDRIYVFKAGGNVGEIKIQDDIDPFVVDFGQH